MFVAAMVDAIPALEAPCSPRWLRASARQRRCRFSRRTPARACAHAASGCLAAIVPRRADDLPSAPMPRTARRAARSARIAAAPLAARHARSRAGAARAPHAGRSQRPRHADRLRALPRARRLGLGDGHRRRGLHRGARCAGATWSASALPLGGGRVQHRARHAAGAHARDRALLTGYPWHDDGIGGERVTPTGAAILRHLVPPERCGGARATGRLVGIGCRRRHARDPRHSPTSRAPSCSRRRASARARHRRRPRHRSSSSTWTT